MNKFIQISSQAQLASAESGRHLNCQNVFQVSIQDSDGIAKNAPSIWSLREESSYWIIIETSNENISIIASWKISWRSHRERNEDLSLIADGQHTQRCSTSYSMMSTQEAEEASTNERVETTAMLTGRSTERIQNITKRSKQDIETMSRTCSPARRFEVLNTTTVTRCNPWTRWRTQKRFKFKTVDGTTRTAILNSVTEQRLSPAPSAMIYRTKNMRTRWGRQLPYQASTTRQSQTDSHHNTTTTTIILSPIIIHHTLNRTTDTLFPKSLSRFWRKSTAQPKLRQIFSLNFNHRWSDVKEISTTH